MKSLRFPIIAAMAFTLVAASACGSSQPARKASPSTTVPKQKKLQLAKAGTSARPSADSGAATIYPVRPLRYVLAGALPDLGAAAPVWRMTSRAVTTSDVQRIADALGLAGKPSPTASGWALLAGGASLTVDRSNGTVIVAYSADTPGAVGGSSGSGGGSTSSGAATPPDAGVNQPASGDGTKPVPTSDPATTGTVPLPAAPVDVPSAADAQAIAQRLLDGTGVLDGQKWSIAVDDSGGVAVSCPAGADCPAQTDQVYSRTVTFSLVVDGSKVDGFTWSVTIGEHRRVDSLYGEWATAATLGSYGLRSTAAVFADLQDGKAQYSGPQPMTATGSAKAGADIAPGTSSSPPISSADPTTPSTAPVPIDVHVTGVSIGLARWNATDDAAQAVIDLVPTYRFRAVVDGGAPYDIEVLALDPASFTIVPVPVPTPEPPVPGSAPTPEPAPLPATSPAVTRRN